MEQRRTSIEGFINERGSITFQELKQAFPEVSEMTLRTDLKTLDQEGRIVRVHGGARSIESVIGIDDAFYERIRKQSDAKKTIAKKAAALVDPESSIYLDSGTTANALASIFPDERATVFTPSLVCALELLRLSNPQVYILGGRVDRSSASMLGSRTIEAVRKLTFNQCFLGVTSCTPDYRLTCEGDEAASLKRACVEHSDEVIALLDSTKIGKANTFLICDLDQIDTIVSDGNLPESFLQRCSELGIKVL